MGKESGLESRTGMPVNLLERLVTAIEQVADEMVIIRKISQVKAFLGYDRIVDTADALDLADLDARKAKAKAEREAEGA